MFEEICLVCGKHLDDDRQAYCSDECQNIDTISPSISSASSTFSSPHLEYAVGGEVPPLMPSALGSALNIYRRDRYSLSSSSASSTFLTDEEEDDAPLGVEDDSYKADPDSEKLSAYECGAKSAGFFQIRPPGLSYARRPSGTNNRSTVPNLHKRTSSGTSAGHVRHGIPRSAPIHSHSSTEEDEDCGSDFGFLSRTDEIMHHQQPTERGREQEQEKKHSTLTAKPKRAHNRASLPAYFSLLQVGGSANSRSSLVSSPSSNTVAHLSPPTPKLTLAAILPHSASGGPLSAIQSTPRGRPRESGTSRGRMSHSPSHSPRTRQPLANVDIKSSVEHLFDWSGTGVARGRAPVRRNSSPPAKMILGGLPSSTSATRAMMRGRARVVLDGAGFLADDSGYSHRRGGLSKRDRGPRGEAALR